MAEELTDIQKIDQAIAGIEAAARNEAAAAAAAAEAARDPRTSRQKAVDERGLVDRKPRIVSAIDRQLGRIPGVQTASNMAGEFLDAFALDFLPDRAKDYLSEIGIGYPADSGLEGKAGATARGLALGAQFTAPMVYGGRRLLAETTKRGSDVVAPKVAAEFAKQSKTASSIAPTGRMLDRAGTQLNRPGTARRYFEDLAQTARDMPGRFYGAEVAGAVGSQIALENAQQEEYGPLTTLAATVAGGITPAAIVGAFPSTMQRVIQSGKANLLPMFPAGGKIRAAREAQASYSSPEEISKAVEDLASIPEGVTPAQHLGNDRALAIEALLIKEDQAVRNSEGALGELGKSIDAGLLRAKERAQAALLRIAGVGRTPQENVQSIIQAVTPPDVDGNIVPVALGQTDEMLDAAYKAFKPRYDIARGFEVNPSNLTGLKNAFLNAIDIPISSTQDERDAATRYLLKQFKVYQPDPTSSAKKELDATVRAETNRPLILGANERPLSPTSLPEIPVAPLTITSTDDLIKLRSTVRDEIRAISRDPGSANLSRIYREAESVLTRQLEEVLPPEIASDLRVVDGYYQQYKVIEGAVFNAADGAMTPAIISASIHNSTLASRSEIARGVNSTVENLRDLARAFRDPVEYLQNPERAALFVRDLDEAGVEAVKTEFLSGLIKRAQPEGVELLADNMPLLNSDMLKRSLAENKAVMQSLGFTPEDITRATDITENIARLQYKTPLELGKIFSDDVATILDLGAAVIGAGTGSKIASIFDIGSGSSLVLAAFFSNRLRTALSNTTSKTATQMLTAAANDPELYKALLTTKLAPIAEKRAAGQFIESYFSPLLIENQAPPDLSEPTDQELRFTPPEFTAPALLDPQAGVSEGMLNAIDPSQAAPDPVGQMTASQQMLRRIPPAPSTRGVPGLGEPANDVAATPAMAPPPSAVAQGPSESSEMMARLFPMDMV